MRKISDSMLFESISFYCAGKILRASEYGLFVALSKKRLTLLPRAQLYFATTIVLDRSKHKSIRTKETHPLHRCEELHIRVSIDNRHGPSVLLRRRA